tara:strand:+ start:171 stop:407 length:237 start_codon:yes stop_codon:yes gene_type:complete
MNDFSVILYGVFFFAVAGATFAFMWKMTTISIESINKPIPRRNVHPEMSDVQSGEELLVFKPDAEEGDDEGDVIIIRK